MERASARDCRSLVVPIMAQQPDRVFTAAELAALLQGSNLSLGRRADRIVFDAMRKARSRGWVVKVGRGRYRFGHVPPTTLRRLIRWRQGLDLGLDGSARSAYASWRRRTRYGEALPVEERSR